MIYIFHRICYKVNVPDDQFQPDAQYFRERAAHFRCLAPTCDVTMAARMLELSIELDAKATELEARSSDPSRSAPRHP